MLEKLFKARYPIQRLRLVDAYRADDDRSMAASNTSGFNCRRVSGSSRWSERTPSVARSTSTRCATVRDPGRAGVAAGGRPYADCARPAGPA